MAGWDGDAQNSRGDALLVKLNPRGELLWSLETAGNVDYQAVNSLQLHDNALYAYGNIAAADTTPSTTLFGHTLSPTTKTNAWSARLNVSADQPDADWVTLLKSLPRTNGKGGRIKVTNACYDNGAFFLTGSLTGFIEINGDTVLANDAETSTNDDAETGTAAKALMGFIVRQDPATGEILGAYLDPAVGLAAEIENVAFRQNKIYAFGYSLGVTWLHVYDADFQPLAEYSLLGANGATAWDALFLDDRLLTLNRGRQACNITSAPDALNSDVPQAYSAYILSHQLDGLQQENETGNININFPETVKITATPSAIRINGHADVKIFSLASAIAYSGSVNGEKEIALPASVYIVRANGRATKVAVRR